MSDNSQSKPPRRPRVFVFKSRKVGYDRPILYAFPEDQIHTLKSQMGSENCYLEINGVELNASFESMVAVLGERVNMN